MKGNFSFAVVNAGQRNVEVHSQLVACSTKGGFRLSGPACKVLGVKPSDYVMFLHDEENGVWAIANGIALKKSDGTPLTCTPREAKAIVTANFESALEQALASSDEKLVAALTAAESDDEKIELLAKCMTTQKWQGSKTANPSGAIGVGAPVNFTDSNVWNQLKKDLDAPETINRTWDLPEDDVQEIEVSNGFETITVKALIFADDYKDSTPARRGAEEAAE